MGKNRKPAHPSVSLSVQHVFKETGTGDTDACFLQSSRRPGKIRESRCRKASRLPCPRLQWWSLSCPFSFWPAGRGFFPQPARVKGTRACFPLTNGRSSPQHSHRACSPVLPGMHSDRGQVEFRLPLKPPFHTGNYQITASRFGFHSFSNCFHPKTWEWAQRGLQSLAHKKMAARSETHWRRQKRRNEAGFGPGPCGWWLQHSSFLSQSTMLCPSAGICTLSALLSAERKGSHAAAAWHGMGTVSR